MRRNKLNFNEFTIRALLHHMLSVLLYCQTSITKPFKITIFDILVFKEVNSNNPNDWAFKLKNCFLENQYTDFDLEHNSTLKFISPNTSFFTDEFVISTIVKIGNIVFDAIKNIYGYNSPLEFVYDLKFSSSLRYVINTLIHYRSMKAPPSLSELLLFFQTSRDLYMEKLRSALFEGVKVKKELFNEVNNCINRSKSCFF